MRSRGLQVAGINAERARPKGRDLEKTADDRDVLEKVDHLVLVGEVVMKEHSRCEREYAHSDRHEGRTVADQQTQARPKISITIATRKPAIRSGNPVDAM